MAIPNSDDSNRMARNIVTFPLPQIVTPFLSKSAVDKCSVQIFLYLYFYFFYAKSKDSPYLLALKIILRYIYLLKMCF